jgi:DEAD/DEAH box helicase domain-containing protein
VDVDGFLEGLASDPDRAASLAHVRRLPARRPSLVPIPSDLPEPLPARLRLLGVDGLYPHQAVGLQMLRAGRNVVLATGTASGKSLVYDLAFAELAVREPATTALFVFPTKALARDQLQGVRALRIPEIRAGVYDGDTPAAERPLIRRRANLVCTNPDMLHLAILADHTRWTGFLRRLALVVVDEAHVLRGVFGSHVALALRRLRRLAADLGAEPRWCLASATIGNPAEHAERLTGLSVEAIVEDTSPRGERRFVLWNPPVTDEEAGTRRSALAESAWLVGRLVREGVRAIAFARSRRAVELLATFARREVEPSVRARIKAYRAGYLPEDRRRLEQELRSGDLVAVAATSALELGIDIGGLDAAVLTGYPGTRASMWQQAGRAGRRAEGALTVLVAQDDPLDQYLVSNPTALFDEPAEAAVIDPENPAVLDPHLRCAARERPLDEHEARRFFGEEAVRGLERLEEAGLVRRRGDRRHDAGREPPHRAIDLRAGAGRVYRIVRVDTGELLGTADERRAFGTLHPGAVYLHQGDPFVVRRLDLDDRVALVEEADPDFTTQARDVTDVEIVKVLDRSSALGPTGTWFGEVRVTDRVTSYVKRLIATGEVIEEVPLGLPPITLPTRAVWWTIPEEVADAAELDASRLPGAIHAVEHCAIGLLPLIATCDRWDVGGVSTPLHPDTGATTILIYDGYPGGVGVAERGFRSVRRWLAATHGRLRACGCPSGCPSCVQSPKCGNGNEPLDKRGATQLAAAILHP